MSDRFADRTVIVTGAGRGIGRAIAQRFADEGAELMLVGRGREALEETAGLIGGGLVQIADVGDAAQAGAAAEAALTAWGRIDVLVNNAGIDDETPFVEMREDRWREVLNTNLTGPFLMSRAVVPHMVEARRGVVIHNASIDATGGDGPFASYSASKAGLLGLNRTMALELGPHGIRVNCVSPGFTDTDMTERAVGPKLMEYLTTSFDRVPMRRLVRPEEIAATCAFLASEDASAITGQNLIVDCGLTANWYILETLPEE